MSVYYPPLGFHFKVEFNNIQGETEFQAVDGLMVELETEQVTEGGENRFKHVLPVRSKYPNLVLKRGLFTDSDLIKWCREALEDMVIEPTDITISLLNEKHEPLMTWNVVHAYPIKWSVAGFNAEESKLVVETIELTYNYFKLQ